MNRIGLDEYFLTMSRLVALRSTCVRRKVGAVLVRDKMVISTGYNDTPRHAENCGDGGCARCADKTIPSGLQLDECLCVHAEQNAIVQAAYHGVATAGSVLYTLYQPCTTCAKLIVNAGIAEVVYVFDYPKIHPDAVLFFGQVRLIRFPVIDLPLFDMEV